MSLIHLSDFGCCLIVPKEQEVTVSDETRIRKLAQEYTDALLKTDHARASRMVLDALEHGINVSDIYLGVFQWSQYEIGRLWQSGQISVAQEHYCTAATQLVLSQLYPYIFTEKRSWYRILVVCVAGELHELGARMVADFFQMEGWNTFYTGANTPTKDIARTLEDFQPHILAVSATMHYHITEVKALISQIRQSDRGRKVPILVGGYTFNVVPDSWRKIGADGYSPDARAAVDLARQLLANQKSAE